MTLLERAGESLSKSIRKGETLTRFAVFTRYPGVSPPVSREEYEEALKLAEQIIQWVQKKF